MDPAGVASALRAAIWSVDAEAPVPEERTLDRVMSESVARRRFQMLLVLLFAAAALALAAFGTYGVVSYAVTRRRAELGIRMALGAQRGDVLRMALRQGMTPVFAGLCAGAAAALGIGQYVASLLFQVSPRDPAALGICGGHAAGSFRGALLDTGAAGDARQPSRCATLRLMGFDRDAGHIYRVPELEAFPWLVHGFGTRNADIPGLFANLATLKQIHSATCLPAGGRAGLIGEGDALLEDAPGAVVAVRTADCIPILLVDERRRAVAAVHAGWRGTAAGIARRAVEAMHERFGTDVVDVHAAIGPGIGECCFEVGPEVAAEFGRGDVGNDGIAERSERLGTRQAMGLPHRVHIDLAAENRRQLLEAGVTGERIYTSNLCTKCLSGDFHSFRRDREAAGRLFSFAGVR